MCHNRWVERHDSILIFIDPIYDSILEALEQIRQL